MGGIHDGVFVGFWIGVDGFGFERFSEYGVGMKEKEGKEGKERWYGMGWDGMGYRCFRRSCRFVRTLFFWKVIDRRSRIRTRRSKMTMYLYFNLRLLFLLIDCCVSSYPCTR